MKLSFAVLHFLSSVSGSLSKNTVSAYRADLSQFKDWVVATLNVKEIRDLRAQSISGYPSYLRTLYDNTNTINRKISSARSFLIYLYEQSYTAEPLSESVKYIENEIRRPQTNQRHISQDEMRALLETPYARESVTQARDAAILNILYATGMRVGELCKLNIQSVKVDGPIVTINIVDKNPRGATIDLQTIGALSLYITNERLRFVARTRRDKQALFVRAIPPTRITRKRVHGIVSSHAQQIGLRGVSPETIRRSKALHMKENGASLRDIQRALGYRSTKRVRLVLADF